MRKHALLFLLFIFTSCFSAGPQIVNIYNWSGYIPQEVITQFEKTTGIKVNYSTYDSNEMLYDKLKSDANVGYDIVVPSTYIVDRMVKQGMLQKIDHSKIPNLKNLDPKLLNKPYDLGNQYSIPYLWGTTGLIVNANYYPKGTISNWQDLWNAKYKNKISLLNDMRDVFAIGLTALGYSINDRNPEHIKQAYLKLKELWPNLLSFASSGDQQMYVNEDSNIGMIDSGDAQMVIDDNPNFYFLYPKDRQIIWIDNITIPANAPHLENAYKFINFILQPEIAKKIAEGVGYSTPNLAAIKLMTKANQQNQILNPSKFDLTNAEVEADVGVEANNIYMKYWELLKLGT